MLDWFLTQLTFRPLSEEVEVPLEPYTTEAFEHQIRKQETLLATTGDQHERERLTQELKFLRSLR